MEFHFTMQDEKGREITDSIVHTMYSTVASHLFIHESRRKFQTGFAFDSEFRYSLLRLQYYTINILVFLLTFPVISYFLN
jgi:hypothetical protein